jgi:hypothetical protein
MTTENYARIPDSVLYDVGLSAVARCVYGVLAGHAFTEFSTLIADRDGGRAPRNDIAALAGKRFVSGQESREGARLEKSLIKTLTGGDAITAAFSTRNSSLSARPGRFGWQPTTGRKSKARVRAYGADRS